MSSPMSPRAPRRRGDKPLHRTAALLIEVAAELIDEVGLNHFTGEEVLHRVGLTSGVLYYHFGDVDGLRIAALAHLYAQRVTTDAAAITALAEQCETFEDFRVATHALLRVIHSHERARYRLQRAATLGLSYGNDDLRTKVADAQDGLTELMDIMFQKVASRGWLQPGLESHALAVFVQAFVLGRIVDDIANHKVDEAAWEAVVAHVVDSAILRSP
jgi:AcrR family transcriptional regulator